MDRLRTDKKAPDMTSSDKDRVVIFDTTLRDVIQALEATRSELEQQREAIEALREAQADIQERLADPGGVPPIPPATPDVPVPPSAGERVGFGESVHIPPGQTVDEVTSFGEDVRVDGRVLGDAASFGGNIVIGPTGRVDGDAVSAGGRVIIRPGGRVDGDRVNLPADWPAGCGQPSREYAA
mgnify:CR=1 FL=1